MSPFQEIYDDVFHLLRTNLPVYLTYHTPQHTAYVLEKAEHISKQENVEHHDLRLIKIAALFPHL